MEPLFSHVEPVLAVSDINHTITYWQEVLGFPAKWTWGDPPNHGGVSWQKVFIQFTYNPALAAVSKGHSIWVRLQHIDVLYHLHQKNKANIVCPLEMQPWGMAQYTVQDINGYYINFAAPAEERENSGAALPPEVRIIGRVPTAAEYQHLVTTIYGSPVDETGITKRLTTVYAVVAEVNGEAIGSALLLGDDASFYYVKDVHVHPAWQGKRVGTAMMQEITRWLNEHGKKHALVALICRETLEPFYQQFGFAQSFAMIKYIGGEGS